MGRSTLYWVQLSNQFPSTHANPCDERMLSERGHAQEFLSGPKLEEVLGASTKQEQLRMPGGGGAEEVLSSPWKNLAIPWPFLGFPKGFAVTASKHLHVTAIELISLYGRGGGSSSRTMHCFVTLRTRDL